MFTPFKKKLSRVEYNDTSCNSSIRLRQEIMQSGGEPGIYNRLQLQKRKKKTVTKRKIKKEEGSLYFKPHAMVIRHYFPLNAIKED